MVAVPETAGVHWKTCSGEPPELPQLPASELVPLVLPLKVPPCAGITVTWAQAPASVVVVVEVVAGVVVVVVGGGTPVVRSDQSSLPVSRSEAAKKSAPPTSVSMSGREARWPPPSAGAEGGEGAVPGLMSAAGTGAAVVARIVQSSVPLVGSEAAKKSVPSTSVSLSGAEPPVPGLMSFTSTVPAAVP